MTVYMHVGQGGLGVARSFWQLAFAEWRLLGHSPFFDGELDNDIASEEVAGGKLRARCVMLDTEPKVLREVSTCLSVRNADFALSSRSQQSFEDEWSSLIRSSNMAMEQLGRGNNWAFGYHGRTYRTRRPAVQSQKRAWQYTSNSLQQPESRKGESIENPYSLTAKTMEALRREAERCDVFTGVICTHSVSGGTGAGLGSRLLEEFRNAYPKRFLLTASITPLLNGETPLQHYNALLTLRHLQEFADGILLFSNQDLFDIFTPSDFGAASRSVRIRASADWGRNHNYESVNHYIAQCLMDIVAPTSSLSFHSTAKSEVSSLVRELSGPEVPLYTSAARRLAAFDMSDFVSCVCPMPSNKFSEVWTSNSLPGATSGGLMDWTEVMDRLLKCVPQFSHVSSSERTSSATRPIALAAHFVVRGDESNAFREPRVFAPVEKKLRSFFNPVPWNPFPFDFQVSARSPTWDTTNALNGQAPVKSPRTRSLTVAVNRSRVNVYLQRTLQRSRDMLSARAYVHWYEQYGCGLDQFEESITVLEDVIQNYCDMVAT